MVRGREGGVGMVRVGWSWDGEGWEGGVGMVRGGEGRVELGW